MERESCHECCLSYSFILRHIDVTYHKLYCRKESHSSYTMPCFRC
uniref:Uncharacterized protein n=1 Tax=Arundo donax TaxID=35708 RepID=A0A0A9BFR6_ARUDO